MKGSDYKDYDGGKQASPHKGQVALKAPVPKEVEGQVTALIQHVNMVDSAITEMTTLLAPVLSETGPENVKDGKEHSRLCPLANQLLEVNTGLERLHKRLLSVTSRIEL